jgi:hypothetical protein
MLARAPALLDSTSSTFDRRPKGSGQGRAAFLEHGAPDKQGPHEGNFVQGST